ncbi:hypothetical protein OUZ56_028029 [Daphnia magna]|uniref:Transposable element P transposase-like GTP-binding insertion domain-containing protein n=1 Tax=Daphnia magna TaxID=35525 RepID=A0ABR0B2M6_9CRUS|nr:hypothetical protein OUZ56_028029 [Daphnia magna]
MVNKLCFKKLLRLPGTLSTTCSIREYLSIKGCLRMTVSLATQLYSKHMAMALKFLREDKKTAHLFNGSEATEKLTKLINDTFDIMNGRHKGESINGNNWNNLVEMEGKVTKGKKSVLEDMLKIIELTEECHRNPGKRPIMAAFASDTTLDG